MTSCGQMGEWGQRGEGREGGKWNQGECQLVWQIFSYVILIWSVYNVSNVRRMLDNVVSVQWSLSD